MIASAIIVALGSAGEQPQRPDCNLDSPSPQDTPCGAFRVFGARRAAAPPCFILLFIPLYPARRTVTSRGHKTHQAISTQPSQLSTAPFKVVF